MKTEKLIIPREAKIGDRVAGFQITEITKSGEVFGVKGELNESDIASLRAHFATPEPRPFFFRPGCKIGKLSK